MRPRLILSAAAVVLTALLTAQLSALGQVGLGAAVQAGDLAAVRALLGAGSDPNGAGDRFRPLATAARLAALDVINALLDAGADPNLRDAGGNQWVPLMHAVHKHQSSSVRLLLA